MGTKGTTFCQVPNPPLPYCPVVVSTGTESPAVSRDTIVRHINNRERDIRHVSGQRRATQGISVSSLSEALAFFERWEGHLEGDWLHIPCKLLEATSPLVPLAYHQCQGSQCKNLYSGPREEHSSGSGSRLRVESFQRPHDTAWLSATARAKSKQLKKVIGCS